MKWCKPLILAGLLATTLASDTPDPSMGGPSTDTSTGRSVEEIMSLAAAKLAQGQVMDAISLYTDAILDPADDHMTAHPEHQTLLLFKRGAAYLMNGRDSQALNDFTDALSLTPTFQPARNQRARIYLRLGQWELARGDLTFSSSSENNTESLEECEIGSQAERLGFAARDQNDFESCVSSARDALSIATQASRLKELKGSCELALGHIREALVDLDRVSGVNRDELARGWIYVLGQVDRGLDMAKRGLRNDPDDKLCKAIWREARSINKLLTGVRATLDKKSRPSKNNAIWRTHVDELTELRLKAQDQYEYFLTENKINTPDPTVSGLVDLVDLSLCEIFNIIQDYSTELGTLSCESAKRQNQLTGHLFFIDKAFHNEDFQLSIDLTQGAINAANDLGLDMPQRQKLNIMMQKAQRALQKSKTIDHYKVLDVSSSASQAEIKRAFRIKAREFHPDKYRGELSKDEVERKMADVNEAWEILGDEVKRAEFDRGEMNGGGQFGGHGGHHPGGNPFQGFQGFGGNHHFKFNF